MASKTVQLELSEKQRRAFDILNDKVTTELFYGGGAGGGKSWLGCIWLILSCLEYPGSRWYMARAKLKNLKQSTLLSFFEICKLWGLRSGIDFTYNSTDGVIKWSNGSEIYLKDLFLYPTDPEFDKLGSTEYTGGFIDECSEITIKAKNIIMSRVRYKLDEFGLIPKTLMASNPSKNFLYYDFYKPWKNKKLLAYRAFIPALVTDNPFISKYYIENLKKLDKVSKERLLYGNFEYDDDPARLFDYDKMLNIFDITDVEDGNKYMTIDYARLGDNKTVIVIWDGFFIKKIYSFKKQKLNITEAFVRKIRKKENVPWDHVLGDEDGLGGGVVDNLSGSHGFVNNSSPLEKKEPGKRKNKHKPNYQNLRSQCYFWLAKYVDEGRIGCYKGIKVEDKEAIIEELEQIKRKDPDKDVPLAVIRKEDIKEMLGRSPDYGDAIMMRMWFVVRPEHKAAWFVG